MKANGRVGPEPLEDPEPCRQYEDEAKDTQGDNSERGAKLAHKATPAWPAARTGQQQRPNDESERHNSSRD